MDRAKILIVDDEKKNIKLLKGMLFSENYELFEACNGEEALEAGADDFLSKPVDQTELVIRIKSLLRIKSYHDELLKSFTEIAEKNKQLLELEKVKESLTHMIIHDLRNPLGALSGFIELTLLKKQNLSEDQIELIQGCASSCHELTDMVQSLLDLHKMEEGKLELKKEEIHLAKVIDSTMRQFAVKAKEKQIELHSHQPDNLQVISVDCGQIKRVLDNLVNNAIRHTQAGGAVTITAQNPEENGCLHIHVEDTGDGLAPEYHQTVFDKFEQVRLKKKGVKLGASGLGLAFCKMAVEAHGGQIWVESEGGGKGASFQFTLPIKQSYESTD